MGHKRIHTPAAQGEDIDDKIRLTNLVAHLEDRTSLRVGPTLHVPCQLEYPSDASRAPREIAWQYVPPSQA
jgi:hypothetical protein